jgi:predicted nucleic acid-binding protein
VTFHYLALAGNKAPLTLKVNKEIGTYLNDGFLESSLSELQKTENNASLSEIFRLMKEYNLLPNDAIILADTINLGIKYIATFDKDLIESSKVENIVVIDSLDRFKELF